MTQTLLPGVVHGHGPKTDNLCIGASPLHLVRGEHVLKELWQLAVNGHDLLVQGLPCATTLEYAQSLPYKLIGMGNYTGRG